MTLKKPILAVLSSTRSTARFLGGSGGKQVPKARLRTLLVVAILLLAGCNGLGTTSTPTATATESPTPTATPTDTPTPTPEPTATPTPSMFDGPSSTWSDEAKYRYFADNYTSLIEDDINVTDTTIEGDTVHLTYTMEAPEEAMVSIEEQRPLLIGYHAISAHYLQNDETFGESWIPERINTTAIDPASGEVFWYDGKLTKDMMLEYHEDESYADYWGPFYSSHEEGPAYSDYRGDD